jgi:hypothetical protein
VPLSVRIRPTTSGTNDILLLLGRLGTITSAARREHPEPMARRADAQGRTLPPGLGLLAWVHSGTGLLAELRLLRDQGEDHRARIQVRRRVLIPQNNDRVR